MTDPLEIVTRAIDPEAFDLSKAINVSGQRILEHRQKVAFQTAHVVLQALRDAGPTEAMIDAGQQALDDAFCGVKEGPKERDVIAAVYCAMITAAIREGEDTQ